MRILIGVSAAVLLAVVAASGKASAPQPPVFGHVALLDGADGRTEPRVAVGPDDRRWLVTNANGTAVVYGSADRGATWRRTADTFPGQFGPSIDVDVAVTRTGRIVASELDFLGVNFPTGYSDDGGKTWTASTGTTLADMDRQWLAVGPDDASTHKPRVYLLYHNLGSGAVTHNMFVMTSTDGGASFGPPIPVTLPGQQAWLDLQCADSGGPSSLSVNARTGRLYAVFGTRTGEAGDACTAQPPEGNIVAATRVWVATSPDNSAGSWTSSLAVDDSASGSIVGMQLSPGTLDRAGNVWVTYPESPRPYPDYSGAAIKVVWAPADLSRWSAPLTIAKSGGPGNLLPHIVAGDTGAIDVAYFHGEPGWNGQSVWYLHVAQSLNATAAHPAIADRIVSPTPTYHWSASAMMGACHQGTPADGILNGTSCDRSTDVWGVALDRRCYLTVTWPTADQGWQNSGTWVATQTAGPGLCGTSTARHR